jgi:transcriptional regulator with XRE-family HTH domain
MGTINSAASIRALEFIRWRWRHGLSLSDAAEALGLSRRQVAYYASGERPVPRTDRALDMQGLGSGERGCGSLDRPPPASPPRLCLRPFIELRGTRREGSIAIACDSCGRAEPDGKSKRANASYDPRVFRPKVAANLRRWGPSGRPRWLTKD